MAIGLLYICRCNARLTIHVPKAQLMRDTPGASIEELEKIDAKEEAQGEIELIKERCQGSGSHFVDARKIDRCPFCKMELNLLSTSTVPLASIDFRHHQIHNPERRKRKMILRKTLPPHGVVPELPLS